MVEDKNTISGLPTVRRLPMYLHILKELNAQGREFVSSTLIGKKLELDSVQVRKDLASTGIIGKPKIGFNIPALIDAIENYLGWDNNKDAFLVGVGSLGSALLGYPGFEKRGLNIVAAFDVSPDKIGKSIRGVEVHSLDMLPELAERMNIHLGIITVPAECAQSIADAMALAGIRGIWNFTQTYLQVPKSVFVQNEDLSAGLAVLSVKLARTLKTK